MGITALVLGLLLLPQTRTRIQAAAALGETLGASIPRPFAPQVEPAAAEVGGVSGRLYQSARGDPAVLIVPGATPDGVEDDRVNAMARGLARSGRTVFIPELELYQERFSEMDLERIGAAVEGLAKRSAAPVTVFGASYGGSFALVAASDPRLQEKVARIGTLGAYFDLVGIIQAVTTGVSLVGGESFAWEADPRARDVLHAQAASLVPEPERAALLASLQEGAGPDRLSPPTRALYELLVNDDPALTFELAAGLTGEPSDILRRFSPSAVADRVEVPVAAMHSTDDPLVPYGELARLQEGLPTARTSTVGLFQHVDFDPASPSDWVAATPDLIRLWNLTTWVLTG